MITLDIDVPASDVAKMNDTLKKYAEYFNGNIPKTVDQTMVKIIVALRAKKSTKESKKVRNIVDKYMPYKEAGSKALVRAHQHIQDWYKTNSSKGKSKLAGRKATWLPRLKDLVERPESFQAIEIYTQKRGIKYKQIPGSGILKMKDARTIAATMYPKQYNIGRRGLARSSWSWMLKKLNKSDSSRQPEIGGIVSVDKSDRIAGGVQAYSIETHNRLGYIRKALNIQVSSFLDRASEMMIAQMNGYKKITSAKIGRAA